MKFIKKPVVIDAMKFDRDKWDEIVSFTGGKARTLRIIRSPFAKATCIIKTLEGDQVATEGDWIIKGIKGEFYACKPDIFLMTYDPI